MKRIYLMGSLAMALSLSLFSCTDENSDPSGEDFKPMESDGKYVGEAVGNFSKEEWYPGGELGTTDNVASGCYEDEAPAVTAQGLIDDFNAGEKFFERQFTSANSGFKGLGPASVRRSCLDCHPNYGHGRRMDSYTTSYGNGNGYLLAVYHPVDGANSNDGGYVAEVTGMPQTQATEPFKAPIDESQIKMQWHHVTAMESGLPMKFPDGEAYDLIYPEITIPRSAFRTNPNPYDTGNKAVAVRVESTIGVMGTGLLDAITEEDIKAQYASTANYYKNVAKVADVSEYVNPNFWNASADDFAAGAWYPATENTGVYADGGNGKPMVKRFTYALTRATLQDGPGANAIWNITNVSRPDRPKLYTTNAWAAAMAEDKEVIEKIKNDPTSPFWASTDDEISKRVNGLLKPGTNQFSNEWHNFEPEMSADHFYEFMVWHRGLAIPRARNLNDARVQQGKKVFMEIGCASCHRPSWKTGSDNYWTPNMIAGKKLPRYANQTIYPYSDMMQHKLYMANDIHGSWCRTTPLWGRGLAAINGSGVERLHDCRARNEVEAIMWHAYSKNSHAYNSALKFYNLSKADRDAVVMFLRSI
ncbi:di-heme oxidoredictase family protein [Leyella stercorea]|uniref:di-heme oxidoredictase family protein n=2 Tax=Leyella stercorea TaxID=363265 RepID=UPI0026DBE8E1|nr:di-heme oxidoredictase family protein [Leyella stercorea]